jgi:uncharacterized membrane protein
MRGGRIDNHDDRKMTVSVLEGKSCGRASPHAEFVDSCIPFTAITTGKKSQITKAAFVVPAMLRSE